MAFLNIYSYLKLTPGLVFFINSLDEMSLNQSFSFGLSNHQSEVKRNDV